MPARTSAEAAPPPKDAPVALITGAARRVGAAIAERLAAAGCDLIITWRSSDAEARALAERVEATGRRVRLARLDLDDLDAVAAFGAEHAAALPRLDVLVHNASNYFPTPLADLTAADALSLYRVNALAPLLLTRALAPRLRRSPRPGGGAVVCLCDIHAMGRPRHDFSAYSMAKAALVEMIHSLALDLAPGARINGVAPGVVLWPEAGYESDEAAQRAYLKRVPLARAGTPEDAAEAVRWLALDAHYTTGQVVRVDGGRFLR